MAASPAKPPRDFSKLEKEVNDWLATKGDSIQPVNSQTATCAIDFTDLPAAFARLASKPLAKGAGVPNRYGYLGRQ